ncbi:hypothetical protein GUJ93_ZPchr0005g15355 [Zizania palustris]|uniref:Uncharacterized protein n=1 Tax=Zizania palustris TaxID=103762 RepID=A0A8J5VIA8_ZIZPA|nr:hypothetical protein GUJ93_ZPchr0005g15355 [Zizania palustris]
MAEGGEQARSIGVWKTKLERMQGAARRQKAKLYIIAACIALLVCGCTHHPKVGDGDLVGLGFDWSGG